MLNTVDVDVRPLLVFPICEDNPEDDSPAFCSPHGSRSEGEVMFDDILSTSNRGHFYLLFFAFTLINAKY